MNHQTTPQLPKVAVSLYPEYPHWLASLPSGARFIHFVAMTAMRRDTATLEGVYSGDILLPPQIASPLLRAALYGDFKTKAQAFGGIADAMDAAGRHRELLAESDQAATPPLTGRPVERTAIIPVWQIGSGQEGSADPAQTLPFPRISTTLFQAA